MVPLAPAPASEVEEPLTWPQSSSISRPRTILAEPRGAVRSRRPRLRAYHTVSLAWPKLVSPEFLVHDEIESRNPVIVTCGVGAGAWAEASGTANPRRRSATMRARCDARFIGPPRPPWPVTRRPDGCRGRRARGVAIR